RLARAPRPLHPGWRRPRLDWVGGFLRVPAAGSAGTGVRETLVRKMGEGKQQSSTGDERCMQGEAAGIAGDTRDQQGNARDQQGKGAEILVAAETEDQRRRREYAGEGREAALEGVVGEESEPECRQDSQQQ